MSLTQKRTPISFPQKVFEFCHYERIYLIYTALLPAFFSSQSEKSFNRVVPTRARAHSQNFHVPPLQTLSPTLCRNTVTRSQAPVSPLRSRQSQNQPMSLLSTPPSNRSLVKQLKLKGSRTDPAYTRRREAFGVVCCLFQIRDHLFTFDRFERRRMPTTPSTLVIPMICQWSSLILMNTNTNMKRILALLMKTSLFQLTCKRTKPTPSVTQTTITIPILSRTPEFNSVLTMH